MRSQGLPFATSAVLAVAARPWLWAEALRALWRFAPDGWLRRRALPLPTPEFAKFRAQTAAGGAGDSIPVGDLVSWLKWARGFRKTLR